MSGILYDTSVVIAREEVLASDGPAVGAISVITLGELHAGVLLARDDEAERNRRRRMQEVRAAYLPLPVDERVAESYGDVLAVARTQRRTARATDLLIIATAAASGRALSTLDDRQGQLAQSAGIETSPP